MDGEMRGWDGWREREGERDERGVMKSKAYE